ncbi:hypothetical protein HDV02_000093 [Globomyces sp. JEL0801]|nr:hypothetical protein HDV02_000093 [Globomyces sp. JEL0801]
MSHLFPTPPLDSTLNLSNDPQNVYQKNTFRQPAAYLKSPAYSYLVSPANSFLGCPNAYGISPATSYAISPANSYAASPSYSVSMTPNEPTQSSLSLPNERNNVNFSLYSNSKFQYDSLDDILGDVLDEGNAEDFNEAFLVNDMNNTLFFSDNVTISTEVDSKSPSSSTKTPESPNFLAPFNTQGQVSPNFNMDSSAFSQMHSQIQQSPSYAQIQPSPSFNQIQPSPSFNQIQPSPSYIQIQPSPSYGQIQPSPSYAQILPTSTYSQVISSPPYLEMNLSPTESLDTESVQPDCEKIHKCPHSGCNNVDLNNESLKKPSNSLSANQFTSEETIQEELDDNQDDLVHQQGTLPPKRKLFIKTKSTVEDEEDDEIHELYSPTQIPSSHRFSIASFNSNTNSIFSSTSSEAIYDQTHRNLLLDQQQNQINKRRKIMNEIVDSEIRYVSDLLFLKNHYIEPLLKLSDTPNEIIPRKVIHDIFYSHEGILATNQELRNQLQDRIIHWNQGLDQTGDIFLNLIPYLKIYSLYVTKFNNSMSLVSDLNTKNPEFAKFLKKNQHHPESHNLVLQAFLIMPVQRIPRYKMLLEDLFKHTPVDHADYENLKKAIAMVSEVATYVNETIREHEMMLKMVDIQKSLIGLKENLLQPGRKFIKRGGVKKICRRADQPRELFLFSDIIIYGSPSLLEDHFHFHRMIPLENCRLVDSPSSDLSTQYVFQIVSREKSFAVYTDTLELKVEWMSAIQGAISDWWLAHDTIQRDILPSTSPSVEFDAPVWDGEKKSRVCDTCLPSLIEERRFRVHIPPSIDFLDSPTDRRNSSSFEYSQPTIRDKRTSGLWGRFSMDSGGLSRASSSSMDDSVEIGGNFKNTIHLSSSKVFIIDLTV